MNDAVQTNPTEEFLVDSSKAAQLLGVTAGAVAQQRNLRHHNQRHWLTLDHVNLGRSIRYKHSDLLQFINDAALQQLPS